MLKIKGGIYSFVNTVNSKQYIGSAKDFYLRLNEHLNNKKSNINLRRSRAFNKYGLVAQRSSAAKHAKHKFYWVIYESFSYENKRISNKDLTNLVTSYIKAFKLNTLYNFNYEATSTQGYIHRDEANKKRIEYYKDKNNHPMYGKTHSKEILDLISKPGKLNPM